MTEVYNIVAMQGSVAGVVVYSVDTVCRDVGGDVDELAVVRLCWVALTYDLPVCFLCVTVVLLDTTREVELNWTIYPFGPQSKTPGVSNIHMRLVTLT